MESIALVFLMAYTGAFIVSLIVPMINRDILEEKKR